MNVSSIKLTLCLALLTVTAALTRAEQLPIKVYTTADGLGHTRVKQIVRDEHGFLWFCTSGGLSRFDGAHFANFGLAQGLPFPSLNDLLQTSQGIYWLASNGGGIIRFTLDGGLQPLTEAAAQARFKTFRLSEDAAANRVNLLYRDPAGAVWAGTDGGLFHMTETGGEAHFQRVPLNLPGHPELVVQINALHADRAGRLWIGSRYGLLCRMPDGRIVQYPIEAEADTDSIYALLSDAEDRLWIGHRLGLFVFTPSPNLRSQATSMADAQCGKLGVCVDPTLSALLHTPHSTSHALQPGEARWFNESDGLRDPMVTGMLAASDGRLWVAMSRGGLAVIEHGSLSFPVTDRRLFEIQIGQVAEDGEGNLWLATLASGVRKLARHGFTTYRAEDGLGRGIGNFIESPTGEFYVTSEAWRISRYDGRSFVTIKPKLPPSLNESGWRYTKNILQDHTGQWWLATQTGLYRFPAVRRLEELAFTSPSALYTRRDGLADENLTRLYEDARGDLWIASFAPSEEVVTRWERTTGKFYRYSARDGLTPFNAVLAFAEDKTGQLWLAFREGGLARYRDGRFRYFSAADGLPGGGIESLYCDPSGRLWFTVAQTGVLRLDDPQADPLRPVVYTRQQGLSSDLFTRLTGDAEGRIYIGTSNGIDRLDPVTGEIKRYTTGDGLANVDLTSAYRDRQGTLWFGSTNGLMHFVPQPDHQPVPPPVLITGLRVAGIERLVSALGATALTLPALGPDQNQLSIEYTGMGFAPGEALRFEYRLEGADRDWSAPGDLRTINFSSLAPGSYRFAVRAVNAAGLRSPTPATVKFRIPPPFWRSWWFIALCALSLTGVTLAFVRARAMRMRVLSESETRFRTLAETASDAIITIDHQGIIVFVNPTTEKIFGYSAAEMTGQDLTMLMPEYLRHLHRGGFERYQQTGQRHISWHTVELPGLHRDGHEIPLELSFGEFTSQEKRYFTGIARDITERKQAAKALQQSREERLRELERVRRRIATDLHDDIGSSLTQISILSEVLHQRLGDNEAATEPLQMIAGASRELVDSMSDIVWAINPQKDHLRDLMQRMRRFAADSFTARNIRFQLRLPVENDENADLPMGANLRREVFLIFKEGVNNMVKHSGCTEADIELGITEGELHLRLTDNGRGFDLTRESDGHGLVSMLDRAKGIGAKFQITSALGAGTTITLSIELEANSMTGRFRNLTT